MPVPRLHHYIPQFYLRNWANKKGLVTAYKIAQTGVSPPFSTQPRNICAERDLYANKAMTASDEDAHGVETEFFSQVDHKAAVALRKLRDGEKLTPDIRDDWTRFLMSLFHRQPAELATLRAKAREEWQQIILGYDEKLPPNLKEGIAAHNAEFQSTANIDAERLALKTLKNIVDSKRIGDVIIRFNWTVYTLHPKVGDFLTGDLPTIKTNALAKENASIVLPISPRQLFVAAASNRVLGDLYCVPTAKVRSMVNTAIVAMSRQYIVASDDSQTRFILNRR